MKTTLILALTILSLSAFAGGDESSVKTCKNAKYTLKLNRKGSFFGKDNIKITENKFLGDVIVNEKYVQDWSPTGEFEVEKVALEASVGKPRFYLLDISENAVLAEVYEDNHPYSTFVQLRNTNEIIKFTYDQCQKR
jgi:hypothetical protein